MRYLLIAFLSISTAYAQNYKEDILKHRAAYGLAFINDLNSPLREADLDNLHFFEPNINLKFVGNVELLKNQKAFQMPTYDGTTKEFIRYAKVEFTLNGVKQQLTLYRNISLMINPVFRDLLFLPFTDLTNQETTYGGGRYIDLNIKDIKKGRLIIDFNKAYNPYCAYSDGYRCPIPPEENDLPIAIAAGEQKYTGLKKEKN